jgi:hypothetical protein
MGEWADGNYGYDALGRRASRTVSGATTSFLYDGSDVTVDRTGPSATEYLHGPAVDEHLRLATGIGRRAFRAD